MMDIDVIVFTWRLGLPVRRRNSCRAARCAFCSFSRRFACALAIRLHVSYSCRVTLAVINQEEPEAPRRGRPRKDVDARFIAGELNSGRSLRAIGDERKVSARTLKNRLNEAGLPVRHSRSPAEVAEMLQPFTAEMGMTWGAVMLKGSRHQRCSLAHSALSCVGALASQDIRVSRAVIAESLRIIDPHLPSLRWSLNTPRVRYNITLVNALRHSDGAQTGSLNGGFC